MRSNTRDHEELRLVSFVFNLVNADDISDTANRNISAHSDLHLQFTA